MTDYTTKQIIKSLTEAMYHAVEGSFVEMSAAATRASLLGDGLCSGHVAEPGLYDSNSPLGYDTVIGYASRVAPKIVEFVEDVPSFVVEQERTLLAACLRRQVVIASATPPGPLVDAGVTNCHAFPVSLLREHFGI